MKGLQDLFNLFYPSVCLCCEQYLLDQEKIICIECRLDLPFIDNGDSYLQSVNTNSRRKSSS